jgi:hypothetical protein
VRSRVPWRQVARRPHQQRQRAPVHEPHAEASLVMDAN